MNCSYHTRVGFEARTWTHEVEPGFVSISMKNPEMQTPDLDLFFTDEKSLVTLKLAVAEGLAWFRAREKPAAPPASSPLNTFTYASPEKYLACAGCGVNVGVPHSTIEVRCSGCVAGGVWNVPETPEVSKVFFGGEPEPLVLVDGESEEEWVGSDGYEEYDDPVELDWGMDWFGEEK